MKLRKDIQTLIEGINRLMCDKDEVIKQFLIGIICKDHILLEDVPGTGKTLLTNTMAEILQLKFRRIQGTPDLLPGDITGVNIYNPKKGEFQFQPGPVFTNILLFDEINRTSPKTQSALLEAMSEEQVSIDNETYKIEPPFFVIATQNPIEHTGTYPLPQAQLDRFFLKAKMGYPKPEFEKKIIMNNFEDVQLPRLIHKY